MTDPPPFAHAIADPDLVERVLRETAVDRRMPAPSWTAYVQDLMEAAVDALVGWTQPFLRRLAPLLGGDLEIPVLVLLIAIAVTLVYLLGRTAVLRMRRHARGPEASRDETRTTAVVWPEDREAWRHRLEAHLLHGDVAPALEALWWWVARSLSGPTASSSWTSRELLGFARRPDLLPMTSSLDRMIYGGTPPRPDEIRALLALFDEALA